MDSTINNLLSESNKTYKLINDILNEFKFSSNRNISGNKSKSIPITLEDVQKVENGRSVDAVGLSLLWDTGASHCVIIQY